MTVGSDVHGLMLRCMFAGCTYKLHFSDFHFYLTWRPVQITPLQAPSVYTEVWQYCLLLNVRKIDECDKGRYLWEYCWDLASVPPAMLAFGQSQPAMSQLKPLTSWGLASTLTLWPQKGSFLLVRGKINRSHNIDRILEILSVY